MSAGRAPASIRLSISETTKRASAYSSTAVKTRMRSPKRLASRASRVPGRITATARENTPCRRGMEGRLRRTVWMAAAGSSTTGSVCMAYIG